MYQNSIRNLKKIFLNILLIFFLSYSHAYSHERFAQSNCNIYLNKIIDNSESIFAFQKQVRKGFDQTPFNYFNTYNNTDIHFMSERFNLVHMARKEILQNYYFIDMGWFWHFNGIPRDFQD